MTMLMINGTMDDSLVLTYRTSRRSVDGLLPEGMEPFLIDDQAFWNVTVSRITHLRHAGLPRWVGVTCHHVAYRLLVHAPSDSDYRGPLMYQVAAQADSALIRRVSEQLRVAPFAPVEVDLTHNDQVLLVKVHQADHAQAARACVGLRVTPEPPVGAMFADMDAALEALPILPPTVYMGDGPRPGHSELSFDPAALHVSPVHVFDAQWGPLLALGQKRLSLELALRLAPMEVCWHLQGPGREATQVAPSTPRLRPSAG